MANEKQNTSPNVPNKREQNGIYSGYAERGVLRPQDNVPNLRFPEFTEDWVKYKISNICKIATGNKNTQDKEDDGLYPFYVRSQNVERINSWTFNGEAILTAGDGVGVGKVFHYSLGKIGVHQRVYILSDFNCNGKFLYSYFSSRFYNRVKRMSAKNSVDSVRMEMIADMPISIPKEREQIKIGDLLSLLDQRIATQNKIIEDLKKLKVAIRDKELNVIRKRHGLNRQILELLDYEQPSRYIVSNTEYSDDSNLIPVLTANKAFILGYTDEPFGIYDKGLCIILDDFTLDCKLVDFAFKIKSSAIKILTSKNGISLRYVYEYLDHIGLETTEHKRHYISEIEPMLIAYPDNNEVVISFCDLMDKFDQKIEIENKYLQSLLAQKSYLLSNMFI